MPDGWVSLPGDLGVYYAMLNYLITNRCNATKKRQRGVRVYKIGSRDWLYPHLFDICLTGRDFPGRNAARSMLKLAIWYS